MTPAALLLRAIHLCHRMTIHCANKGQDTAALAYRRRADELKRRLKSLEQSKQERKVAA